MGLLYVHDRHTTQRNLLTIELGILSPDWEHQELQRYTGGWRCHRGGRQSDRYNGSDYLRS